MFRHKKILLVTLCLSGFILFLSQCINHVKAGNDPRGRRYAGSINCRQCHQAVYDSMLKTSHFNATVNANSSGIHGNFTNVDGHFDSTNSFPFNAAQKIVLEKRDSGYYQVLYENGAQKKLARFDILFGKKHAQTALYWMDNNTYELPLSYYNSINGWATSPGFSNSVPNYDRFIGADCFECHSSYVGKELNASTKGITESLKKETLIFGIDCERCHGGGLDHVNYHLDNPDEKVAKYIRLSSSFSRQQKLDACAVCHSGNDKMKLESRFKFKMGDTLANFFMPRPEISKAANFDVHGNQYSLLSESKCFLNSNNMTCSTCHNPHTDANESIAVYSQKCISCHNDVTKNVCPKLTTIGESIKANCIDCHMPALPSRAITFLTAGANTPASYLLRTHKIAVYADSANQVHSMPVAQNKNLKK